MPSILPSLPMYQTGLPAPRSYQVRPADNTPILGGSELEQHGMNYQAAQPFTDATGYVWRNRAAYDSSLAEKERMRLREADPVYQQSRFNQNNLNMGIRSAGAIGIPGTETNRVPAYQQPAIIPPTNQPPPQTNQSLFGAARQNELPYWMRQPKGFM